MTLTKQQDQQVIRSMIQSRQWETDPKWFYSLKIIVDRINFHNKLFKNDNMKHLKIDMRADIA